MGSGDRLAFLLYFDTTAKKTNSARLLSPRMGRYALGIAAVISEAERGDLSGKPDGEAGTPKQQSKSRGEVRWKAADGHRENAAGFFLRYGQRAVAFRNCFCIFVTGCKLKRYGKSRHQAMGGSRSSARKTALEGSIGLVGLRAAGHSAGIGQRP